MAGGPFAGSGTGEGNEDVGVEAVVEEGERVEAVPPHPPLRPAGFGALPAGSEALPAGSETLLRP